MTEYRRDIDGLRAIAILLVIVFHFNIFQIGKAGFIGVDIFFVISGFLIGHIITRDLHAGTFTFGGFLYRRVRRLYPAMLATLLLFGVFGYVAFLPDLFKELAVEAVLSQLYVVNVYFWRTVNYFGLQTGEVPLLHMWSLAIEEQFYLIFPLFCLGVYKIWPRGLLAAFAISCGASFVLGVMASGWKPEAAFYLLPTRAWEFLIGAVLALSLTPKGRILWLAGPVGLALIVAALVLHTPATQVPGWYALLPALAAVLIIIGGGDARAPVTRALCWGPMVWLGQISYPLYLVHWPVLIGLKNILADFDLPWRIFGLLLSIALGFAIHVLVERPVKSRRILARPAAFLSATAMASAVLIGTGVYTQQTDGIPTRFAPPVRDLLAYAQDLPDSYQRCSFNGQAPSQMCRLGDPQAPVSKLIIGDSHARALAGAVDLWLKETGQAGLFAFEHECMPIPRFGRARCVDFGAHMLNAAIADRAIEEVIAVSIWRQPFEGSGILFDNAWLTSDRVPQAFADTLAQMTTSLSESGTTLTLIDPLFAAPRNVPATLAKNAAFGHSWSVDTPLEAHNRWFTRLFDAFARAETMGARRVSLIEGFCTDGLCKSVWQGRPIFSDNNHLAFSMSPVLASVLTTAFANP
ncbi:MAG: acyltransferase family protein [Sulfitobacter sp.]